MTTPPRPAVSVLVPLYRPRLDLLRAAVASVLHQTHSDWELVLVDDGSRDRRLANYLRELSHDSRIVTAGTADNRGISTASNLGVSIARGEYIALLDQDDLLDRDAMWHLARAVRSNPEADLFYSDRVTIAEDGQAVEVFRKPDWSPERLRCNMYIAHLTVLRRRSVLEVGGFDPTMDGAQDHDLVLRVTEQGRPVVHIPRVLYYWRQSATSTAADPRNKPHAREAGLRAVRAHLNRTGAPATARPGPYSGLYRVDRVPVPEPLTVVLLGDQQGSSSAAMWLNAAVEEMGQVRLIASDWGPGQLLPRGCDVTAAPRSGGHRFMEQLILATADVRTGVTLILDSSARATWSDLRQVVATAQTPDVGAAGARVLRPSGRCVAAGLGVRGRRAVALGGELFRRQAGPFARNWIDREVSGVFLSCCALPARSIPLLRQLPSELDQVDGGIALGNRIWAEGGRVIQVNSADVTMTVRVSRPPVLPSFGWQPATNALGVDRFSDPTRPRPLLGRARDLLPGWRRS